MQLLPSAHAPASPLVQWLRSTRPGACSEARRRKAHEGSCATDDSGEWELSSPSRLTWPHRARECLQRCAGCERCRHVSIGMSGRTCMWYHACTNLSLSPGFGRNFRSGDAAGADLLARLRASPPAPPWPGSGWVDLPEASERTCNGAAPFDSSDCEFATGGLFQLHKPDLSSWASAAAACQQHCERCSRCRYVAVSLAKRQCIWYAYCIGDSDLRKATAEPPALHPRHPSRPCKWCRLLARRSAADSMLICTMPRLA